MLKIAAGGRANDPDSIVKIFKNVKMVFGSKLTFDLQKRAHSKYVV